jgi:hypothetical protein
VAYGLGKQVFDSEYRIYWAIREPGYVAPENPYAARTVGDHVWGGQHLNSSHLESWTWDYARAEEFLARGRWKIISRDIRDLEPWEFAADLSTEAGRAAAVRLELNPTYANYLLNNLDSEVVLWRFPSLPPP